MTGEVEDRQRLVQGGPAAAAAADAVLAAVLAVDDGGPADVGHLVVVLRRAGRRPEARVRGWRGQRAGHCMT